MTEEILRQPEPPLRPKWLTWAVLYEDLWVSEIHGLPWFGKAARVQLIRRARESLGLAWHPRGWLVRHERFTHLPYVISGWADTSVHPTMFGDGNSSVGLATYALWLYACT